MVRFLQPRRWKPAISTCTRLSGIWRDQQIPVEMVVRHARTPTKEIVRYAEELKPDLVVMGAHGHKGLKDIVFGTTINAVRHKLKVPLLIVRGMK